MRIFIAFLTFFLFATSLFADNFSNNSHCNNWYKHYNQSCYHIYPNCSSSCEAQCSMNSNQCEYTTHNSCSSYNNCSNSLKCAENCISNETGCDSSKKVHIQDSFEAPKLYKKACDDGDAGSCFKLGVMLTNGDSVKQDKKEAKQLFGKACDMKHQCACRAYANLNL